MVIAPYEGLKNLFHEVISKKGIKNTHVYSGELRDGVKIAKQLEKDDYDVIISRGATAQVIRREVNIPVIEVEISGYDILRTLQLVEGYSGKIGLMSYMNVISGIESVGELLQKEFSLYPIRNESEIERRLQEATRNGVEVIIGDSFSATHAEKYGMKSILLSSGEEAIVKSLHDAELMSLYLSKEKQSNKYVKSLVDNDDNNIIILDNQNKIRYINNSAENLLDNSKIIIGKDVKVLGDEFTIIENDLEKNFAKINRFEFNDKSYEMTLTHLKDKDEIIGNKIILVENQHNDNELFIDSNHYRSIYFNHFVQNSELMKLMVENAMKISGSSEPVIIYGDKGTGKSELAKAIHNNSNRNKKTFSYLNCKGFSFEKLYEFFVGVGGSEGFSGVFENSQDGTVYLDNIETLSIPLQLTLKEILKKKYVVRKYETEERLISSRVIMGTQKNFDNKLETDNFDEELYRMINQYVIQIPPLEEHKEDIDDYTRWFIANYNKNSGKQFVGLSSELQKEIKDYPWPGNIVQLRHTIEKMCESSNGPYIEIDEVKTILADLKSELGNMGNSMIDISNKTLNQIELEVIEKVFNLENQNQTSVSKKLNISRSTLWRKLNKLV